MSSRRAAAITAILSFSTGTPITDGYTAYQQMLPELAGIQQCAAHVIRRRRALSKLGPGGLQSWSADVIIILRQAHLACQDARSRGQPPHPQVIKDLRKRYDEAVSFGITHNRHRDLHDGNHPGSRARLLAARLRGSGLARSPASPLPSGRTTSPNKEPKPPNGTRPSPATGTPRPPSPAGAGSAATSTPPPPTA